MRIEAAVVLGMFAALSAGSAHASPQLQLCLPVAPKSCALTADSKAADFLKCFKNRKLRASVDAETSCDEELRHAKIHRSCDASDIPKVCAGIVPGQGRVMDCLRTRRKALSPACRAASDSYWKLIRSRTKRRRGSAISATRC